MLLAGILLLLNHLVSEVSSWPSVLSNVSVVRGLAFVFGIAAVLYGMHERSLRRAEVERFERRISELEQHIEKLASGTLTR